MISRVETALLLLLASAPPAVAQAPGRTVFTGEEIQALGFHRFSELFHWLAGSTGTVGALGWMASPDGLPTAAAPAAGLPGWTLLLDGRPIEPIGGGSWFPDLAPVVLPQIDSVEVIPRPAMGRAGPAPGGEIRVHTRRIRTGPALYLWGRHGNETGDPGPFLWTPHASENVDRVGADRLALVSYGGEGWAIDASYRSLSQETSDARLQERFRAGEIEFQPFAKVRGPTLRASVAGLGGTHTLSYGQVEQRGFAYLPFRSRMENSDYSYSSLGLSGAVAVAGAGELAYSASRSRFEIERRTDPFPATGGQDRESLRGSLALRRPLARGEIRLGGSAERHAVDRADGLSADPASILEAHAGASHAAGKWKGRVAAAVAASERAFAPRAAVEASWYPDSTWSLVGLVTAGRYLPQESVQWLDRPGSPVDPPWSGRPWVVRSVDGGFQIALHPRLLAEAGAFYTALEQDVDALPSDPSTRWRSGASAGLRGGLRTLPGRALSASGEYRLSVAAGGDDAYERAMGVSPRHRLRAWIVHHPVSSLRFGGAVDLRSGTDWSAADLELDGAAADVPAVTRLDLSVEKWLWERRLRTQIVVRNALNSEERYHPHGARFDLRYFISGSLTFPRPPAPSPSSTGANRRRYTGASLWQKSSAVPPRAR